MKVPAKLRAVLCDEAGATLVEYALVMALLSAAAVTALSLLGQSATDTLSSDGDALTGVGRTTPGAPT
ncbi:MAG: hypothetical protein PVSMB8_07800 [Vulcanimicrobiaceae bacterium]